MSYVMMSMLSHEFPKIPSSFVLSYVMYTARAIPPSDTSQDIPFISVYKELEISKNINYIWMENYQPPFPIRIYPFLC